MINNEDMELIAPRLESMTMKSARPVLANPSMNQNEEKPILVKYRNFMRHSGGGETFSPSS